MADNELKESSERTLSDDLWDAGETALAIGAGAALLYRSGGAIHLVQKASRFLTHAHSEVSARSLADWTTSEIKDVASGLGRMGREISISEVIRALPKNDRKYFMEFDKERDPEKDREDIPKVSSPFLKRALKHAWGENLEEMESNSINFMSHNLPGFTWSGWRPDVDMADVQIKTIHNEGMLLSNFGSYGSQLHGHNVVDAPNLEAKGEQDSLTLQANLQATLKRMGLWGVDVSVQTAPSSGIQVVANVARAVECKIDNAVHDIFRFL